MMLFWLYNLILLPVLFPYLAWRLLVRGKSREGLWERFGSVPEAGPEPKEGRIWMHAVSMGEMVAAVPVSAALRAALPGAEILVSTTTPTGQAQARRDVPEASLHFYFPFDLPWVARRVLARLQPSAIVLMEAELWPNLVEAARRCGIPVVIANGHVSDRTLRRATRLRPLLAPLVAGITRYLAQSAAVRDRAIALGLPPERVWVSGHTKFDQKVPSLSADEAAALRAGFGLAPGRPLLLAGSTHEGEEEQILAAWEIARRRIPDLALMLAPRHLARVLAIRTLIEQRGYAVRARSEMEEGPASIIHHGDTETRRDSEVIHGDGQDGQDCRNVPGQDGNPVHSCEFSVSPCLRGESSSAVLLLDTMGELSKFYGLAAVAFVGGSLVPKGGHDILQPLFHGVPTLFGPHMHNQRALAQLCVAAGAVRQVRDGAELAEAVVALVTESAEREQMLAAAERLLAENRGASARCAAVVAELVHSRLGTGLRCPSTGVQSEPGGGNREPELQATLQR
jgi:3-deoxy-D-manno-octulosonic-acid transferase